MIVIGHKFINHKRIKKISSINDIKHTLASDIVWLQDSNTNIEIAKHCMENSISYAVAINSIKSLIIFANLGASYMIIKDLELAKQAQKIANEYFLDSKILYTITNEEEIENIAILGIDGVIFNHLLEGF